MSRNLLRLPDGRLLKVWSINRPNRLKNKLGAEDWYVSFSSDEGRTWGGKRTVLAKGERVYLMNDRPLLLSTGRIVIPFSKHPDHLLGEKLETVGWAGACYSDDGGETWREGRWLEPTVADQLCEPVVFERADGVLTMLARTGMGFLYETQSTDGGESWGLERPTSLRQPCAPFAARKDPFTGYVFVVWNNTFPGLRIQFPRTPFCLGVSKDDGRTWQLVKELGANPNGSYGYPTIHFTKESVLVAHYESDGTRNFLPATQTGELEIVSRNEIGAMVLEPDIVRVPLKPGEYWWGGATYAGREQPFSAAADYPGRNKDGSLKWDMRFWNYHSQIAPLLLSSKGRYIWCEEPFGFEQKDGVLTVSPEKPAAVEVVQAGSTLRDSFRAASARHFPPQGTPDLDFFRYPILNTWVEHNYWQSESNTVSYARKFLEFVPPGVFMIDCTWQRNFGNWEFDPGRYPDPKRMVKTMNDMGYRMMLWMAPMVSTDGMTYCRLRSMDAMLHGNGLHDIAEVNYWAGKNAVIDCTNPAGYNWLKGCLDHLMKDYGIEGFFFDAGDVKNYPKTARPYRKGATSCEQSAAFHSLGDVVPLQQHRASWKSGGKARMCTLFDRDATYAEMKASIGEMLNAGLLGYPFINADMVGGGQVSYFAPFLNSPPAYFEYSREHQEYFVKKGPKWLGEFYVRFLQMECLSPMIQFSFAPWHLDKSFHQVVKDMVALRQKWAPYIVECARTCGRTGEPMMRSLEYAYPGHGWEKVDDEFLMGDDLLVAPQVYEGAASRKVVIPPGTWKADDGNIYEGPKIIEVRTPITRLPHFTRE